MVEELRMVDLEPLSSKVRLYLKKQWLHFASLAFCSILILIDTTRDCREDATSYLTSVGFAGLGHASYGLNSFKRVT